MSMARARRRRAWANGATYRAAAGRAQRSLRALGATLLKEGGRVVAVRFDEVRTPPTLAQMACLRHLRSLRRLSFYQTSLDAAGLTSILASLPWLDSVSLYGTSVDDGALAAVVHCPMLRDLHLCGTAITDGALPVLCSLHHLERLTIDSTAITPQGVLALLELPLRQLRLDGGQASPACMAALAQCRTLEDLALVGPLVTDDTIAFLDGMRQLRQLSILSTSVTNNGLGVVARMTGLEEMVLNMSEQIDDGACPLLTGMTWLNKLHILGPGVTRSGVEMLTHQLAHTAVTPTPIHTEGWHRSRAPGFLAELVRLVTRTA